MRWKCFSSQQPAAQPPIRMVVARHVRSFDTSGPGHRPRPIPFFVRRRRAYAPMALPRMRADAVLMLLPTISSNSLTPRLPDFGSCIFCLLSYLRHALSGHFVHVGVHGGHEFPEPLRRFLVRRNLAEGNVSLEQLRVLAVLEMVEPAAFRAARKDAKPPSRHALRLFQHLQQSGLRIHAA